MTILATVGGKYEQDEVVKHGNDLATAFDEDLVVLHIMEQEQFKELRGRTEIKSPIHVPVGDDTAGLPYVESQQREKPYNLEDAVSDACGVAQECISRTLSGEDQSRITIRGRVGSPADEIIAEARKIEPRYICVGGRKRSAVGKAVFGSTAQSVILESDYPVVTSIRSE
ncbi:universal stress protein [Halobellus captivus]|uniref:universal stress protein n=1 Tax=Halobellus captivus TaxID=2592614 RepID=UPI0011A4CE1E|nr:universal stress protein [Halobellus captivus]